MRPDDPATRLLIVTQAVDADDPVLGFFVRWIEEFAKQADTVTVFALRVGDHQLPSNVTVLPLRLEGNLGRIRTALRLIGLSWRYRASYGAVFVHMNMEHILAAGWLWRLLGKRISLWYMHKAVSLRLRLAIPFVHRVFTGSAASMRIATPKKRVMGHGLDTARFPALPPPPDGPLSLVTAGRLSLVKRVDILVDAVAALGAEGAEAVLIVLGDGPERGALEARAASSGIAAKVRWEGPVANRELVPRLAPGHIFVHASATGSLDKAPLEALSLGIPVITTNEELAGSGCPAVFLAPASSEGFKHAILSVAAGRPWADQELRERAHAWIAGHHDLERLIARLVNEL